MQRLTDKVAVITGGARGIGRATARKFLAEGAAVAIWDIDERAGRETLTALSAFPDRLRFYRVDTAQLSNVEEAVRRVLDDFGRIDILVNNAGITRDASLKNMTPEEWQQVIDVNLTGVFNCTKAVSPHMVDRGAGRILNAASVVGLYGNFGQTNYVAAKAGVIGMTRVWARELGRKGITVNAVAPGFIQTDMVGAVPEQVLADVVARTPLGCLGEADDIANAYAYLASDEAAFITSAVLSVDGGLVW